MVAEADAAWGYINRLSAEYEGADKAEAAESECVEVVAGWAADDDAHIVAWIANPNAAPAGYARWLHEQLDVQFPEFNIHIALTSA